MNEGREPKQQNRLGAVCVIKDKKQASSEHIHHLEPSNREIKIKITEDQVICSICCLD